MSTHQSKLGYDPKLLPRELKRFYISASPEEKLEMLNSVGAESFEHLFADLKKDILFHEPMGLGPELSYNDLAHHLESLAEKNKKTACFLGDGLKWYQTPKVVADICGIRGLTTAYTPYQPERSQGTLYTLWIYQSTLSMLTGFEAINASLYERSTCLYEAMQTALRLKKGKSLVLLSEAIYPGDIEVIKTLSKETKTQFELIPTHPETGETDLDALNALLDDHQDKIAAVAFCQENHLGVLEDVDRLVDLTEKYGVLSIGIIDPMLLGAGGLKKPSQWGSKQTGATMIVGEGQHLTLDPNFGGPGLGIFGVRYNEKDKLTIRNTAGRYVGKGKDLSGKECLALVLSTREQHIRREKATSNICSNQSFVASIAGAALLARGDEGMKKTLVTSARRMHEFADFALSRKGINLAFPEGQYFNQLSIELDRSVADFISRAAKKNLQVGINLKDRTGSREVIQIFFNDNQSDQDLAKLKEFFLEEFPLKNDSPQRIREIQSQRLSTELPGLPRISEDKLLKYYEELGQLNLSPDDNLYPLGSCTMKYNPHINDWAASLEKFRMIHPQAPESDIQGCLEVLFEIQERFKKITGLPGVTTQPVAGAQGELVGLKLFQAYHRDLGEKRDLILIPKSAHGTNPATATMAGFESIGRGEDKKGILIVDANERGQINLDQVKGYIAQYGKRISGVMVTNPNTSGIFEENFKDMADLIHEIDGLVYMDGANMNAIAGWVHLGKLGVDAVHNNLHKTWTIPHGGGGPGDAIVAVSEKLIPYLPGIQVEKNSDHFSIFTPQKSIGSFHRHYGNFAHKVRAYTYLRALGDEGVKEMSAFSVLSARYLYKELLQDYPTLPEGTKEVPRMHEFILTLGKEEFEKLASVGIPKAQAIPKIGKIFLDFGVHAPTVAFPEALGMMIEPTESFTKSELDKFSEIVKGIKKLIHDAPEVFTTAPHFTPIRKVDEVGMNKNLQLGEKLTRLPEIYSNPVNPTELSKNAVGDVIEKIIKAHEEDKA